MFTILVRGKKDREATRKAINIFYPNWGIKVGTLGGVRSSKLSDAILDKIKPFTLVLTGRRDIEYVRDAFSRKGLAVFAGYSLVNRSEVRNARLEMIAHSIDKGRSIIRAGLSYFDSSYIFAFSENHGSIREFHPEMDNFLILTEKGASIASEITGVQMRPPIVVYKYGEGLHEFYNCGALIATARFEMNATRVLEKLPFELVCKDNRDLLASNQTVIKAMDLFLKQFLEKTATEQADKIIIPWSGGKDSTAVLIAATKIFGKDRVIALFSDTGVEFPETINYIEKVVSQLGVDLHVEKAGLDKAIMFRGLPKLDDRWCTGLKLEALKKGMIKIGRDYGNYIILVGDRDAESKLRVKRSPIRVENGHLVLSPLKLFSGAQVELYIKSKSVPLNPLYEKGFYRVGCYVCPSLRHWELSIVKKGKLLGDEKKNIFFNMLLKERMAEEDD
ncbi:MAG: phosphoadenosine phosphosulfate reductase family protein [Desulfurococcales archaeon]|nr:phosphoadenosine phosphosulfate reductase family protein [Desulfurococcales archaeon]